MKHLTTVLATLALAAPWAFADTTNLPAEKQRELAAAGRSDWTAGQERGAGQPFATLDTPIQLPATRDTQTMQYDSGAITALPTTFGQVYGNRFSEGVGGVQLDTVTLNGFSFYFAEDSVADTGLFFQAADPLNATNIIARASLNIGGLVNNGQSFSSLGTINVVNQTALGTTGQFNDTFYLGAWCLNSAATVPVNNETLGLDTTGPGFKGYTAASGTATVAFAAQPFNAVLRANVTSPNAVPVELMAFESE